MDAPLLEPGLVLRDLRLASLDGETGKHAALADRVAPRRRHLDDPAIRLGPDLHAAAGFRPSPHRDRDPVGLGAHALHSNPLGRTGGIRGIRLGTRGPCLPAAELPGQHPAGHGNRKHDGNDGGSAHRFRRSEARSLQRETLQKIDRLEEREVFHRK